MNQITPFLEFQVCYMNNFKLLTFYYHVLRAEKVLIYRNEHVQIRKNNGQKQLLQKSSKHSSQEIASLVCTHTQIVQFMEKLWIRT